MLTTRLKPAPSQSPLAWLADRQDTAAHQLAAMLTTSDGPLSASDRVELRMLACTMAHWADICRTAAGEMARLALAERPAPTLRSLVRAAVPDLAWMVQRRLRLGAPR